MKDESGKYGQAFKDRAVARMLPPESASAEKVGREIGVSADTLDRWRSQALPNSSDSSIADGRAAVLTQVCGAASVLMPAQLPVRYSAAEGHPRGV